MNIKPQLVKNGIRIKHTIRNKSLPENEKIYYAKYFLVDELGNRLHKTPKFKSLGVSDYDLACKIWQDKLKKYNKQKKSIPETVMYPTTINEAEKIYNDYRKKLTEKDSPDYKKSTVLGDARGIKSFFKYLKNKYKIEYLVEINNNMIDDFFMMKKLKVSRYTISNIVSYLNTMFNYFKESKMMPEVIFQNSEKYRIKRKGQGKKPKVFLKKDQLEIIFNFLKENKDYCKFSRYKKGLGNELFMLMLIGIFAGPRLSEAIPLSKRSIDMENNIISILETQTREDEFPVPVGKTKNAIRKIKIHKILQILLKWYLKICNTDYLFPNLTHKDPRRALKWLYKSTGIKCNYKQLRDVFATKVSNDRKITERDKITMIGHSNYSFTQKTYVNPELTLKELNFDLEFEINFDFLKN